LKSPFRFFFVFFRRAKEEPEPLQEPLTEEPLQAELEPLQVEPKTPDVAKHVSFNKSKIITRKFKRPEKKRTDYYGGDGNLFVD
jgi:hypothetical protein